MERVSCLFLFIVPLVLSLGGSKALHISGGLRDSPTIKPIPNANIKVTTIANGDALIEKACQATLYKDFCITTFKSRPEAQTQDLKGLAFLSMKLAKEHANVTAAYIAGKLKDEDNLPSGLEDALEECNDQYDDALAQIEDSMQAFFANAKNDVKTWLSTAITNADTCEQTLKDSGVPGALGDRNIVFEKLCSSALSATGSSFQQ
ncbi:hypothetical protein Droror1_Dr00018939 [Drosera rotundifolia]